MNNELCNYNDCIIAVDSQGQGISNDVTELFDDRDEWKLFTTDLHLL